jgi:hypothetical protein
MKICKPSAIIPPHNWKLKYNQNNSKSYPSLDLIYFTFRQIFTDMEVIHRSTRKCAEHLSQHNLQKEKKEKTKT